MSKGIEVTIHDCMELEARGATLESLSRLLRWLGARVFVDTGGYGRFVLQQLQRDGIAAEPLPKQSRPVHGPAFPGGHPEHDSRCTETYCVELDPTLMASRGRIRDLTRIYDSRTHTWAGAPKLVPVSVEAFDRLNAQVTSLHVQVQELAAQRVNERLAQLGTHGGENRERIERLEAQHVSIVSSSVSVRSFNERVGALERGIDLQGQLLSELKGARVAHLERIESLERINEECIANAVRLHAEKDARLQALERFAAETDRALGEHKSESSISTDVRYLLAEMEEARRRIGTLEAYEADRDKADPPIDATAGLCEGCNQPPEKCWRSEDCPGGRHYERAEARKRAEGTPDEKAHERTATEFDRVVDAFEGREPPDPTCDGLAVPREGETLLEAFNRIREETQKAAHDAQMSKQDAAELARYRAHTPGGQLRHGYRPDGSIGYDGLDKAPEDDDPALTAHCEKLERRAALAQSLNPFTTLKLSDE